MKNDILNGKWWKIKKNIKKKIYAKYDKILDWQMDPKGYFLIKVDQKNNLIKVGYCTFNNNQNQFHEMTSEIIGKTAIEIVNTLIREGYISTLQHAADMGIELQKAELALENNLNYIQDGEIKLT